MLREAAKKAGQAAKSGTDFPTEYYASRHQVLSTPDLLELIFVELDIAQLLIGCRRL